MKGADISGHLNSYYSSRFHTCVTVIAHTESFMNGMYLNSKTQKLISVFVWMLLERILEQHFVVGQCLGIFIMQV